MKDCLVYVDMLFDNSTDGYIQLLQLSDGGVCKVYNTPYAGIKKLVEERESQADVYITPNTFYRPGRAVRNIRQFRALYIDLDITRYHKAETVYLLYILAESEKIPRPSLVVDSGKGLHIYWKIKNAPYAAIDTWQALEDYLYNQLKHLGADPKATDGARVMRLPGTINSKNNAECKVLYSEDIEYSMYELREKFLHWKPVVSYQLEFEQAKKRTSEITKGASNAKINYLYNSYSLHMQRIEDLKKLCALRNYDVEGCRNFILHCFAYWLGIYVRDPIELEKAVIEFNNAFKKPLKESEVKAILRCIPKAIEKFIEYVHSGGMKDKGGYKGGYWYTNKTLIERLRITPEEERQLETIISKEEKYRRKNKKRRDARRNEEGLTMREQHKQKLKQQILSLREQGLKLKEIAAKLDISYDAIKYHLYR